MRKQHSTHLQEEEMSVQVYSNQYLPSAETQQQVYHA